ncbi:MLP-like protein 28 [Amaranthus tricolor]|uniref:MLP-like protein 28 n=1 Tax=Amaranthus tricolor TaxID=29722 RepID=UPI0025890215|nr:MLP-like protein 28 [Amaranthus tricolor]
MAQLQRVDGQVELKCHADMNFDLWANKINLFLIICPDKIKNMHVEGQWNKAGSVITTYYAINRVNMSLKARVLEIDEKNKLVRYKYFDGLITEKYYKTLQSKLQVIPKGNGCIVKWSIEYEKINEDSPDANVYIDFLIAIAKDGDAYLCKA